MTSNLKKYRYDMRNEFLSSIHDFSIEYSDLLYFLGMDDEDNLAQIIKNKIFELAEVFDIIDYNYFYQTEIGNVIISLFSDVLEEEEDELYYIEAKVNSSYVYNFLYFLKKRLVDEKWLIKYRKLCDYYRNVSLDNIMDIVVDRFNRSIEIEEEDSRVILLLIDDFNRELEFLINNNSIDEKYNKCLVRKIS